MFKYALMAALVALCASVALNGWQRSVNAALRAENAALRGELATCDARITNITEDMESDAEIDAIDLHDFDLPDNWLRPTD